MQENDGVTHKTKAAEVLWKVYSMVQNIGASRLCFWDVKNRAKPDSTK